MGAMKRALMQCLSMVSLLISSTIWAAGLITAAQPTLGEVVRQIAARTGVTFVVSPCLAEDRFSRAIPAELTKTSTAELLEGYNYWGIEGGDGRLVKVVVSGRIDMSATQCGTAGVGAPSQSLVHGSAMLFRYEPMPTKLPDRYRQMPPGSVSPISLPIEELNGMELGEHLTMSLPDGQYEIVLENRFDHDNGDVTWVGSLDGLESNDRVIVTGGAAGSVGQVVTPEATYSIELEAGRSWLVDTAAHDLQVATDSLEPAF
jgi:hypothetical protein